MSQLPRVLICDDDRYILLSLKLALRPFYHVFEADNVPSAQALISTIDFDVAVIDLNFVGQELDGIFLMDYFAKRSPDTIQVILSGDTDVTRAVKAANRRPFQFIHKSNDNKDELLSTISRAVNLKKAKEAEAINKYLSNSPKVKDVLMVAKKIMEKDKSASILITGESGSGKEQLVKHICESMGKKVVAANMASIPKETAESTLFGHVKGAFTGATNDKIGLLEVADKKVFFLDEIGECSPDVQAKLLRAVQEKEIQPMGSNFVRKINPQFIAATHRDLNKMVEDGTFRLDLLQRLNTFVLRIPPLRERPEDIILYADMFLSDEQTQESRFSISSDGQDALLAYNWPGNIRELRNVIKRFATLSNSLILNSDEVNIAISMGNETQAIPLAVAVDLETDKKRAKVINALSSYHGNKTKAAESLGISVRTLHRWFFDLGLGMHEPESEKYEGAICD
ncbi:MAG TPA: sigma-54 dependent transcriptional regulator [Bacteriovoracaceae bacterium]|nr:sigma-54 dependent transcriptional regulator [Bacteriovoracaceae bacterium]